MPFRPPKKQPEFADLKGILAQTKQVENPLYQTVAVLIDRLTQFRGLTVEQLADINESISNSESILNIVANKKATYITVTNESINLPNSAQLLAGTGILFDYTVPNKLTIHSTGSSAIGNHYDAPLSDGDLIEANLIYAAGECIIVQVPV